MTQPNTPKQDDLTHVEAITKRTFKGDSNSREWQLMDKLAEVTAQLNRLTDLVATDGDVK